MRGWNPNTRNTKAESCWGDIVEDDSGAYADFTEQGSFASHMTAAKVTDVIARLPDCDGQAADAELDPHYQKYERRVVLRGDIVKGDSGSYAVFSEQGSSESQMTAANVMDIKSRLPRCSGQAADAISVYTQVKKGRCTDVI